MYAGHDESFRFILETFLKKNKFDFRISNHYESFKKNLINNDYHVGILDEEIIKGKSRVFYNDINNLSNYKFNNINNYDTLVKFRQFY